MPLGREMGLSPGHVVLDGDTAPLPQRGTDPNFRSMSVVAKWSPTSASAEPLSMVNLGPFSSPGFSYTGSVFLEQPRDAVFMTGCCDRISLLPFV